MNTTTKTIILITAGVVAGALAGLLFAPDKGSNLRRKFANRTRKVFKDAKGTMERYKEEMAV